MQLEAERADTETNRALAPELESHNATKHLYTLVNQQLKKANLELGENLKNVNFGEMSEDPIHAYVCIRTDILLAHMH